MIDLSIVRERASAFAKEIVPDAKMELVYEERDTFLYEIGNDIWFRIEWKANEETATYDLYVAYEDDGYPLASEIIPNEVSLWDEVLEEVVERVYENGYIIDDARYF